MVRAFVVAFVLSCVAAPAWAQAPSAPGTTITQAVKPAAKKPAAKAKTGLKPAVSADNGACDIGVMAAASNRIMLQKIGLTVFGNEEFEVPSDAWGIDDLIFARVRAAANPGVAVKRIAVSREALYELYEKPGKGLFNNPRENLTAVVRQIAANSRCARYIVVTRFAGNLAGTNQALKGIGVYTHGPFGKAAVFAYISLTAFDGQTFAIRDDPFGSFGARMSAAMSRVARDDSIRTADTEFPASPEEAATNPKLRDTARALVTEKLDKVLPEYLRE